MNKQIIILVFFLFISINFVYAIDGLKFSTSLDRKKPTDASASAIPENEAAEFSIGDKIFWNYMLINRKIGFRTGVCFYLKDLQNDKIYDLTKLILERANKEYCENKNPKPEYCPIKLNNLGVGITNDVVKGNIFTYVFPESFPEGKYELIAQLREPNVGCSNPDGSIIPASPGAGLIAETVNDFSYRRPNIQPLQPNIKHNIFVLEDDGELALNVFDDLIVKKFYEVYPDQKNKYDFLVFHFQNGALNSLGGLIVSPHAFTNKIDSGTFLSTLSVYSFPGSDDRLLGGFMDTFIFDDVYVEKSEDNDPISMIDSIYFGLLIHEITHHWGVALPRQLKEATVNSIENDPHFEGGSGSWVAVDHTTRRKYIEKDNKYYLKVDCTSEPRHHGFDLYSMGLKSPSEVKEKLVIPASESWFPTFECDTLTEVPNSWIRRSYGIYDFINVLGPREPSVENSQKNFNIAFVMIIKKGSSITKRQVHALNWIIEKFPIVWFKSTEGRSTLNSVIPNDLDPPIISNVEYSSEGSSITVKWKTSELAVSYIIYTDEMTKMSRIYPFTSTNPPKFSDNHEITIRNTVQSPLESSRNYHVKIISIDENYNMASYDLGERTL